MNRFLFACLVFFATAVVSAQTPPVYKTADVDPNAIARVTLLPSGNVSVRASQIPAFKPIRTISDMGYDKPYEVVWRDMPRDPISVDIIDVTPDIALIMILTPLGYRYDRDSKQGTITVMTQDQLWERAPRTTPPIFQPPPTRPSPTLRYSYSAAVLPDNYAGGPTWMDYRMEESRLEQEAMAVYNFAVHEARMAQIENIYITPPRLYGVGSGFGYFRNPAIFTEGAMKTTGDVNGVQMYIEGCYAGPANQFNSWWDQRSALLAGKPLTITAKKRDRAFSRTVVLPSVLTNWAVGAKHLPFGIEDSDFKEENGSFRFSQTEMDVKCRNSPMATAIQ